MEKFDAIVVGGGPAGCAAAVTMSRAGLDVLLFERGKYVGAKATWGGAFYGPQLRQLFPDFLTEAPFERFVGRHAISFMTDGASAAIDFRSTGLSTPPYNGYILLRARFDNWMAKKAEAAGTIVAGGMRVDDLVMRDKAVTGVSVGKEEFGADVVVLADGVNSLLAEKAGLRQPFSAGDLKQGVKEIIELPRDVIDERFNLTGDRGAALEFVGACTRGLPGGGFIYTNKESLSVGIVVELAALTSAGVTAHALLEGFKTHPDVRPLIKGGTTVEYSAHLIPTAGLRMVPRLHSNGIMVAGDAAALLLGTGLILEGANFAVASGVAAGEAVIAAKKEDDFSAVSLSRYQRSLESGFVLKDLRTFRHAHGFLKNPRIYGPYADAVVDILEHLLKNDGTPRKKTFSIIREVLGKKVGIGRMLIDLWRMRKAL
jgi:electron transfer flavoprotein-quinone oxidoreductase